MTMRYNGRSRPAARGPPLSIARVLARSRTRDTRRPRLPLSVLLQPVLLQLGCLRSPTIVPRNRACRALRAYVPTCLQGASLAGESCLLLPVRCILTGECRRGRM